MDERIKKLSDTLVNYSCAVKQGEKVYVDASGVETEELTKQIIRDVYAAGGIPFVHYTNARVQREILLETTEEQLRIMAELSVREMEQMDCYIGIRGSDNISELSDVPADKMNLYKKLYATPVHHDIRVCKTKWVILRYPNGPMAQLANMSTEAFTKFFFDVCTFDYRKMSEAMKPLVEYMERTDQVRLTGPGTDLTFSIKGIPAIPCAGAMNIPDGEVFTAPIKNSVNGKITYNTPSVYEGVTYEKICFTLKDGKIIDAVANETERINKVLDTDEGGRYIGEFAIGVNPYILHPMKDTLFDEKIKGSIHFTPGACYEEAPNGNKSAVHWDLVLIQRADYGGGEMYFDDVLVRKDGVFVVPELEPLNFD